MSDGPCLTPDRVSKTYHLFHSVIYIVRFYFFLHRKSAQKSLRFLCTLSIKTFFNIKLFQRQIMFLQILRHLNAHIPEMPRFARNAGNILFSLLIPLNKSEPRRLFPKAPAHAAVWKGRAYEIRRRSALRQIHCQTTLMLTVSWLCYILSRKDFSNTIPPVLLGCGIH